MAELTLRVPEVDAQIGPDVELRQVYVEEWIEKLPLGDPPLLAYRLGQALSRLRRAPVAPKRRLRLLECYLIPFDSLYSRIRNQRAPVDTAEFERQFSECELARALAIELAYGFKLALADAVDANASRRVVAHALQRAALMLAEAYWLSCHGYLPMPSALWSELLELYRFGRTRRLDNTLPRALVRETSLSDDFRRTLNQTVIPTVVLGATDPKRLGHGELWSILETVALRELPRLESGADPALELPKNTVGVFSLTTERDYRPTPWTPEEGHPAWVLDAGELLAELHEVRNVSDRMVGEEEIHAAGTLATGLSRRPVRQTSRRSAPGHIRVLSGLASIHAETQTHSSPSADRDAVSSPTEIWDLVDVGRCGLGLTKGEAPTRLLPVGELIGMRSGQRNDEPWRLGIVRWKTVKPAMHHRLGIEWLASEAKPVSVSTPGSQRASIPALLIQQKNRTTLLAGNGLFKDRRIIEIRTRGQTLRAACVQLIEKASSVERMMIRPAPD
ncbi:MAG: hypothetical protein AAF493_05655 [Pseudomonadota bacterium]